MTYTLHHHRQLCDALTPVQAYLLLRDEGPTSALFESTDYHSREDAHSVVAIRPLETLSLTRADLVEQGYAAAIEAFLAGIDCSGAASEGGFLGVYGTTDFEAVRGMDPDSRPHHGADGAEVLVQYSLFRFVLIFDHFKQLLDCWEFCPEGEASGLPDLLKRLASPAPVPAPFFKEGDVSSTLTRAQFEDMVRAGIRQCHEGEVFQVVYSRHFEQAFKGDDFQVYRALRSINPSPFLYYLDDGNRRLFGSSPEAQLLVRDGVAEVHPIAGTVKRTEDEEENANFKFEAYAEPQKPGRRVQQTSYPMGSDDTTNDEEIARRLQEAEYANQPPQRTTARGGNAIGSGGGLAAASGPWGAPRQPAAPAASAVRTMVPRLPGSCS